jgi:hypothetical protein
MIERRKGKRAIAAAAAGGREGMARAAEAYARKAEEAYRRATEPTAHQFGPSADTLHPLDAAHRERVLELARQFKASTAAGDTLHPLDPDDFSNRARQFHSADDTAGQWLARELGLAATAQATPEQVASLKEAAEAAREKALQTKMAIDPTSWEPGELNPDAWGRGYYGGLVKKAEKQLPETKEAAALRKNQQRKEAGIPPKNLGSWYNDTPIPGASKKIIRQNAKIFERRLAVLGGRHSVTGDLERMEASDVEEAKAIFEGKKIKPEEAVDEGIRSGNLYEDIMNPTGRTPAEFLEGREMFDLPHWEDREDDSDQLPDDVEVLDPDDRSPRKIHFYEDGTEGARPPKVKDAKGKPLPDHDKTFKTRASIEDPDLEYGIPVSAMTDEMLLPNKRLAAEANLESYASDPAPPAPDWTDYFAL